jgi:mannosyltransferase OCH1-like enzyme
MNNYIFSLIIVLLIIITLFFLQITTYKTKKYISYKHNCINNINYTNIPNIIHRTWYSNILNIHMYNNSYKKWIELNPNYTMIWNTDKNCKKFMKKYGNREYHAWKKVIATSYKADLWRACKLYQEGGVYIDSYATPCIPIDTIIKLTKLENNRDIFISALESYGGVHNGFMITTAKHPIIKQYIENMVSNIEIGIEKHIFEMTGPLCLSNTLYSMYNKKPKIGLNEDYYLFDHTLGYKAPLCPIYYKDQIILNKKYDIIDCTLYQKLYKYLIGSKHNYTYINNTGKVCHNDDSI